MLKGKPGQGDGTKNGESSLAGASPEIVNQVSGRNGPSANAAHCCSTHCSVSSLRLRPLVFSSQQQRTASPRLLKTIQPARSRELGLAAAAHDRTARTLRQVFAESKGIHFVEPPAPPMKPLAPLSPRCPSGALCSCGAARGNTPRKPRSCIYPSDSKSIRSGTPVLISSLHDPNSQREPSAPQTHLSALRTQLLAHSW